MAERRGKSIRCKGTLTSLRSGALCGKRKILILNKYRDGRENFPMNMVAVWFLFDVFYTCKVRQRERIIAFAIVLWKSVRKRTISVSFCDEWLSRSITIINRVNYRIGYHWGLVDLTGRQESAEQSSKPPSRSRTRGQLAGMIWWNYSQTFFFVSQWWRRGKISDANYNPPISFFRAIDVFSTT